MTQGPNDNELLRSIVDAIDAAVFVVDAQRKIMFFNEAAEALTGRRRQDVLGRTCSEALRCAVCGPTCGVLEGKETGEKYFELPTADGGRVLVRRKPMPLRDEHGQIDAELGLRGNGFDRLLAGDQARALGRLRSW